MPPFDDCRSQVTPFCMQADDAGGDAGDFQQGRRQSGADAAPAPPR